MTSPGAHIADLPVQITPKHLMRRPNAQLRLYKGQLLVSQGTHTYNVPGSVALEWLPGPRCTFVLEPESEEQVPSPGSLEITIKKYRITRSAFFTRHGSSGYRGTFVDALMGVTSRSDDPSLGRLLFHVPNMTDVVGTPTREGSSLAGGRQQARSSKWNLVLDPVPGLSGLLEDLRRTGGFVFTHVGTLERVDGKPFRIKQATDVLERLHVFLSFARGRWTGPMLTYGETTHGKIAWRQWATWKSSPWRYTRSWLPYREGFADLFGGFMQAVEDDHAYRTISAAIHWYVEANDQAGGVDGGLILAQTALELLAWHKLVNTDELLDEDAFGKLTAYQKIRLLLRVCGIPVVTPSEYAPLLKTENLSPVDAVGFITMLRNGLVHPPKSRSAPRHKTELIVAAWTTALWFLELALLRILGYRGQYHDRKEPRNAIRQELVPWA